MSCADGTGMFIGFTVMLDWRCLDDQATGNQVTETQALIRKHDDAVTVASLVRVRSGGEWINEIESFDSPRPEDGCGSIRRMRKGCGRTNPAIEYVIEYNGEYAIEKLVGAEGTFAHYNPDGSRREGYGWISAASVIPNQAVGEESLGSISVQFEGGGPKDLTTPDRGFVKFFDAAGNVQHPAVTAAP